MTKASPRLISCGVDGCANLLRKVGRSKYCSDLCSRRAHSALTVANRTSEQGAASFARWYAKHGQRYRDENRERLRAYARDYYAANSDVIADQQKARKALDPDARRVVDNRSHWKTRYNLTPEDIAALLDAQGGTCANRACGAPLIGDDARRMHIDHDHGCCSGKSSCGKCVRGLLCHNCNVSAGLLGDDPLTIIGLALYIDAE